MFAALPCRCVVAACGRNRENDLVKLEIKINGEPADPLSVICHRDNAYRTGRQLTSKLKELIPRQMFRCVRGRGQQGGEFTLYTQHGQEGHLP